jgi:hypothetical protein
VRAAGVGEENGNYKRLIRVGFYCQIIIIEACFIEGVKSAALEERFTVGALRLRNSKNLLKSDVKPRYMRKWEKLLGLQPKGPQDRSSNEVLLKSRKRDGH